MNADTINFKERILHRLRMRVSDSIDLGMVEAYTVNDIEHFFTERMVYQLRSDIWSEKFEGEIAKYPSNWIQAFKERWFPKWLEKKYPVKYTSKRSDFTVLYPRFRPAVSESCVTIMSVDGVRIK
jgi:hypothetical protein